MLTGLTPSLRNDLVEVVLRAAQHSDGIGGVRLQHPAGGWKAGDPLPPDAALAVQLLAVLPDLPEVPLQVRYGCGTGCVPQMRRIDTYV